MFSFAFHRLFVVKCSALYGELCVAFYCSICGNKKLVALFMDNVL